VTNVHGADDARQGETGILDVKAVAMTMHDAMAARAEMSVPCKQETVDEERGRDEMGVHDVKVALHSKQDSDSDAATEHRGVLEMDHNVGQMLHDGVVPLGGKKLRAGWELRDGQVAYYGEEVVCYAEVVVFYHVQ